MSLATASSDVSAPHDHALDRALVDVETPGLVARRARALPATVVTIGPDGERTGELSTLPAPVATPGRCTCTD